MECVFIYRPGYFPSPWELAFCRLEAGRPLAYAYVVCLGATETAMEMTAYRCEWKSLLRNDLTASHINEFRIHANFQPLLQFFQFARADRVSG